MNAVVIQGPGFVELGPAAYYTRKMTETCQDQLLGSCIQVLGVCSGSQRPELVHEVAERP